MSHLFVKEQFFVPRNFIKDVITLNNALIDQHNEFISKGDEKEKARERLPKSMRIPGLGPLLVAGPLVSRILGAPECAVVVGGLSELGAGLNGLGIPKDSKLRYESALKIGKFVLIVHGSAEDATHAKGIIDRTSMETLDHHQ